MKAISHDLRQRIIDAHVQGDLNQKEIAERFMVSYGLVKKLLGQWRRTGSLENFHHRSGRKRLISGETEQRLLQLVREQPDATLEELKERLGLDCNISTIHRTLKRLGESYKKKGAGS